MSIISKKLWLFGGVATLAISTPVLANNYAMPLRGAWSAPQYAMPSTAYVPSRHRYIQSQQLNPCYAPCSLQTQGGYAPQNGQYYGKAQQPQPTLLNSTFVPQLQAMTSDLAYMPAPVMSSSTLAPSAPTLIVTPDLVSRFGLRGRTQPEHKNVRASDVGGKKVGHYNVGGLNVRTSTAHTNRMLDWQENTTGKALTILQHRRTGVLASDSLYLGAGMKGGLMWQQTEVPGQFPILSRFPFFSNRTDTQTGVFAINNAALAITGTFGDWTSIYLQPEYSETDFSSAQDEMQLRKAFVTFGNLDKTPFYAAFGRKTIDFGNFDGYNPFTQTEAQHYFWAMSDQPVLELGYYKNGLKITGSAFSAGRQLRTAYAGEDNNIGNYAASIEKEFLFGKSSALTFGTSYLHDSIYRNNFTAHTFQDIITGTPPSNFIEYRNSIASAFVEYNSDTFDAMLEYTTTFEPWAAVIPQDIDGNIVTGYEDFDEKLAVTVAQVRYRPRMFNGRTAFSAVGTWGNISDDEYVGTSQFGTQTSFGKNQQHVLGVEHSISEYFDFGAEYVYNKGFIPFVAPQQVSNQDTEAHAVNIGFKARF